LSTYYGTDVYSVEGIRIMVEREQVSGRTFMWASDITELAEGTWRVGRVEEEGSGGNDIALSTSRRLSRIMEIFGNGIEICLFFII
jgi:hypothetical protein